jgi:hypothetical protein
MLLALLGTGRSAGKNPREGFARWLASNTGESFWDFDPTGFRGTILAVDSVDCAETEEIRHSRLPSTGCGSQTLAGEFWGLTIRDGENRPFLDPASIEWFFFTFMTLLNVARNCFDSFKDDWVEELCL